MTLPAWMRDLTLREIAVLVLLVAVIVLAAALQGGVDGEPPSGAESQRIGWQDPAAADELAFDIFARVNDERVARGARVLAWDAELAVRAQRWSVEMIGSGRFEHSTADFRAHPRYPGTGENLAIDSRSTTDVHVGLMRSEGHRVNILEPDYDAVGIGVVCRNDGMMWVTQIFGLTDVHQRQRVDLAEDPIHRDDRGLSCP